MPFLANDFSLRMPWLWWIPFMTTTPKMALAIATRAVSSLLLTYVVLVDSLRLLYHILPSSILYTSSGSPRMSRPRATKGGGSRDIGTLFDIELWWREQYRAIQGQGYILRPRYHPNWRPSWKRSSKAFYTEEDGQPSLVSVICLVLPIFYTSSDGDLNGRNARVGWKTSHVQDCP